MNRLSITFVVGIVLLTACKTPGNQSESVALDDDTNPQNSLLEKGMFSGVIYKNSQRQRGLCQVEVLDVRTERSPISGTYPEYIEIKSAMLGQNSVRVDCQRAPDFSVLCMKSIDADRKLWLNYQVVYNNPQRTDFVLPSIRLTKESSREVVECKDLKLIPTASGGSNIGSPGGPAADYVADKRHVEAARTDFEKMFPLRQGGGMVSIGAGGTAPSDMWIELGFRDQAASDRFASQMAIQSRDFTASNGNWLYHHRTPGFPGDITLFVRVRSTVIGAASP